MVSLAAQIQLHLIPFLWLLVIAVVLIQLLSIFLTVLQSHLLVAWTIGMAGVVPIYLRKPSALARTAYFFVPLLLTVAAIYAGISSTFSLILGGIPNTMPIRLAFAFGSTLILSFPRFLNAFYDLRFPLWGDARILDRLSRGKSAGNFIYFTAIGRAYIQERFGTSPEDFLRIVRRQGGIATGA